jgi:hypothetical protein
LLPEAPKPPKVVEAPKQEVKLLVKDHTTNVEDAIRRLAPFLVLLPQVMTMMGPSPAFMNASKITPQELAILNGFQISLSMNMQDLTIQDRFNRAVRELSKLVISS